jgi:predicted ATPase
LLDAFRRDTPRGVLAGLCEPLTTPAALGPILDMTPELPGTIRMLLDAPHDPVHFRRAFLEVLEARADPTLMIIDDAQWADEATLDLLRYLGRRMPSSRLMVVLSYRTEEVGPRHPLRVLAGDLASGPVVRRLDVPSLTFDAVAGLAAGTTLDPADLFRRTGGNPFFVTECLAVDGDVPASVRDAVLARASRLDTGARQVLEATSCLGYRVPVALAAEVAGVSVDAVDRCIRAECSSRPTVRSCSATSSRGAPSRAP